MKLVLYSGGNEEQNRYLNLKALEITHTISPKLAFIPSSSYDAENDYKFFVKEFAEFGILRFMLFCIDMPFTQTALKELLSSDLIFLGGGNTFYFLKHLKKTGMINHFKKFLKRGGVLCGLSAGAIVLTPHVHTATFPHFDRDENPWHMKNLSAMRLVNFEFFPHYKNSKRYDAELLFHSKETQIPLYACSDGSGIIIDGEQIAFCGKIHQFFQGKKLTISQAI